MELTLCKPHIKNKPLLKNQAGVEFVFAKSIEEVADEWGKNCPQDHFVSVGYLKCIEYYRPTGIDPFYCIVKEANEVIGILYFQHKFVKLKENLREIESPVPNDLSTISNKIIEAAKRAAIKCINFHTIVAGNLLLTGKYGFHFHPHISKDKQFELVAKASEILAATLANKGCSKGLILLKDFYTHELPENFLEAGFTKFQVDPKMIITIEDNWKTFEDYLESLKSKYRVRARKCLKFGQQIVKRVFDADDIRAHKSTIHRLYKNISDTADFNAFILHEDYFEGIKRAMGDQLTFMTYYVDGEMIAFFTSVKNYEILDAHFLGYNLEKNTAFHIYQNMLFDLIAQAIDKGVKKVDLSRTAIEIKSTVGAVPQDMYLYMKHSNKALNLALPKILGMVKPSNDYVIRSPFRDLG